MEKKVTYNRKNETIMKDFKAIIKKWRRMDAAMLTVLVLLAMTIPVDIIVGNYLKAATSVLWVFVGIRAYAVHERVTESTAEAVEIIEAQDQLIDKLKEVMSVMATRQLEADKNNEKVSEL